MKVFKYLNFDKIKTFLILLLLTITLGGFIRFYKISQIPAGYYFDEITVGVNSYFLANSLKDEFGNTLPDFIKIADDYRHGAIFYATAPFVRLLGLNILSVRLSTAFFGLLIVVSTFFLSLIITNQKKIALLSSMFVAISPWLINMSRSSNEVILALFFLILSATSFLLAQQGKKIFFILLYLFMILAWFSYSGAIMITLMYFSFFLIFSFLNKTTRQIKVITLFVFLSFLIFPNLFYLIAQPKKITGRFDSVSIFANRSSQLVIEEQLRDDSPSHILTPISRIFHNKLVNYSTEIINNYSQYFSAQFLFGQEGGPQRYKIPNQGLLYFLDIPFVFLGIYFLFKKFALKKSLIVFWLIAGAFPASLTFEDIPNMQRSIFMLPAWQIIIAVGLYSLLASKNVLAKRFRILIIASVVLGYTFFLALFLHQLFFHQPTHKNWYRDSEWQEAVKIIDENQINYKKIEPYSTIAHYFLMFYSIGYRDNLVSNSKIKEEYLNNRKLEGDWQLGKYYFRHEKCKEISQIETDILYSVGQNCPIPTWARTIGQAHTSDRIPMITFFDAPYSKEQLDELKLKDKLLEVKGK